MSFGIPEIFDPDAVLTHRQRISDKFLTYNFLYKEIASRLADRKGDVKRGFENVLEISLDCSDSLLIL